MKLDALDHPKTIDLAANLGVCIPQAIGHLELLWVFVGQKTPRGNIGRWSNAVIAHNAQWTGSPDDFVTALVAAGFLDQCEDHRLLVHDWIDHMPRWVKAKLAKEKKEAVISVDSTHDSGAASRNDSKGVSSDCSTDDSSHSVSEGKGSVRKGSEGRGSSAQARTPAKRKTAIPKDFQLSDRVKQWAEGKGFDRLDEHLEAFVCKAKAKGYKYVDWDSAFMEAVRKDWAGTRDGPKSNGGKTGTASSDAFWQSYEEAQT